MQTATPMAASCPGRQVGQGRVTEALHGGRAADSPGGDHHRDGHGGLPDRVPQCQRGYYQVDGIGSASTTLAAITSSQLPATPARLQRGERPRRGVAVMPP